MPDNLDRFLHSLFLILAGASLLNSPSIQAAPVAIHKATTVPAVQPLPVSIGGRMLITPSDAAGFGGKDYTSQWPGSYFTAVFEGPAVLFRIGHADEILHVIVDGQAATPLVKPEPGVYEADGLSQGRHTISVFVATESQAGPDTFGGFAIAIGAKVLAAPTRRRQIEFIGDSHTVGYGNLSPKHACTRDETWADTDDTQAFGALTARHYDADYQVNAISGRGIVRNYNGFAADTLPQAYPFVLFDKQQRYKDASWQPQVIVIALGTNDFSTPLNPGERWKTRDELHADYEATYLKFLVDLRARNPKADIVVWATDMANGEIESEARKVVDQRKAQGDGHIIFLAIHGLGFGACDWHPSLADDRLISEKLIQVIDEDPGVWPKH